MNPAQLSPVGVARSAGGVSPAGLLGTPPSSGIDWQRDIPPAVPAPGCIFFEQTRHNLCDQAAGNGFRTYWTTNGLAFDGQPGTGNAESLVLWGYPLTEAYVETNADGDRVLNGSNARASSGIRATPSPTRCCWAGAALLSEGPATAR